MLPSETGKRNNESAPPQYLPRPHATTLPAISPIGLPRFFAPQPPCKAQLAPLPGLLLAKLCNKKNDTPPDPHPFRITKRPVSAFNTACFAPVNGLFQNVKQSKHATT